MIGFSHIWKTGGTSFCQLLRKNYGSRFWNLFGVNDPHGMARSTPVSYLAVAGDFYRSDVPGPDPWVFTVVRDAGERFVSTFEMIVHQPLHHWYEKARDGGFERFLEEPKWLDSIVRFFAEVPEEEPVEEAHLEVAIENAPKFQKIVSIEKAQAAAEEIGAALGWSKRLLPHLANRNRGKPWTIRGGKYASRRKRILEANALDVAFLEYLQSELGVGL